MQKVDNKKKKKGKKFQKRAIHRTPKQITHDYDSCLCVHTEQDRRCYRSMLRDAWAHQPGVKAQGL